ncbi:mitogen-activated protein kinase kinase kinase 7-like [Drosophila navojoa]|uniref:mitogen-activated protein kinase kinase kinase 7-like n=1 Tax=Drosophila navojoa TaxID=7232 RepID=UPI0011BD9E58|nr:mitogen-activated protein kinase kinase kinase 7-like [Drosophila navojoa]
MNAIQRKDIEFDPNDKLGKGSFGAVYKGKYKGKDVAIKKISSNIEHGNIQREPFYMSMVRDHANFVKLYAMVMERTETLLVMEYISGGSLYDFLHKTEEELTYSNAINLLCQAAEALAYLHAMSERPVIHRDVKSLNMLVDAERKNLKICDFGFVRQSRTEMTEARGTLIYMAPEVFKGKMYAAKCDVYSMGITIWEILARKRPYYFLGDISINEFNEQIDKGLRPSLDDLEFDCPDELKTLIQSCWDKDADARPTMQEVVKELQK